MISNPEARVGLFTVTAVIFLISLFIWLSGTNFFQRGTEFEAIFTRIEGIRPGAAVKYIGVDVGRVTKIYFDDQQVIVGIRIQPGFEIPKTTKAIISSSGVVGDKFIELTPTQSGEPPMKNNRIIGQSPPSIDQFYTKAYEIIDSLGEITDSLNQLVANQELTESIKQIVKRVENIAVVIERLSVNSEPKINELLSNINQTSTRLSQASLMVYQFLNDVDNNGQTAADLRESVQHINKISANLEKLSNTLVENNPKISELIDDAQSTLRSIDQAAQTIEKAVREFSSGDGDLSEFSKTIKDVGAAAQKLENYVSKFEQIRFSNNIGVGYEKDQNLKVDYSLNVFLNDRNSIYLKLEDIGEENLGTFQLGVKYPHYLGRAGIYRNRFGLGIDFNIAPNVTLGLDAWDTDSPNIGVSSLWKLSDYWSMTLSTSTNLRDADYSWNLGWWYQF